MKLIDLLDVSKARIDLIITALVVRLPSLRSRNLLSVLATFGMGLVLGALLFGLPLIAGAQGPDTTFTYQGRLLQSGQYLDGVTCDFRFGLYTTPSGGSPLGTIQTVSGVAVTNGYFTANLDFGDQFDGGERYLQVAVRCPPDASYTTLSGRVRLNAAPYALYARNAANATHATDATTAITAQHVTNVDWLDITSRPPGLDDGDDDQLLNVCAPGLEDYVPKSDGGGGWSCGEDRDTDTLLSVCTSSTISNAVAKWNGSAWQCQPDNDTNYSAGSGLMLSGTQFSLSNAYRLPQTCSNNQLTRWNNGAWECQPAYSPGTGLNLSGSQFSLADSYIIPQGCDDGQLARWNGSVWVCSNDIAYSAGDGIDNTAFDDSHIIQVTVSDFAGDGLQNDGSNNLRVNASALAGDGLQDDGSNNLQVNVSAIAGNGLENDGSNNLRIAANGVGANEIASDAVGMSEIHLPMGSASDYDSGLGEGTNRLFPVSVNIPAAGDCMVMATATILSGGTATGNPHAYLKVAQRVGGTVYARPSSYPAYFPDVAPQASASISWVFSVSAGVNEFGCQVYTQQGSWYDDEEWTCTVSYMCGDWP